MKTKHAIFIGILIYGVYDLGIFVFKGENTTISQVMTDYFHLSPFGAGVIFMILGHWLWPMTVKPSMARLKKAWDAYRYREGDRAEEQEELSAAIKELVG